MAAISVTANTCRNPNVGLAVGLKAGGKPEHWQDAAGSSFVNPWPSFRVTGVLETIGMILNSAMAFPRPKAEVVQEKLPIRKPTWGLEAEHTKQHEASIRTTWLGHACFLVEFPTRSKDPKARGVRVLFDPVFSHRCSPFSWMGPMRYTPPPCNVEDIPDIDAIVISHNHYDHMDTATLKALYKRSPERPPQIFAPLGNAAYFQSIGVPEPSIQVMDWWDSKRLSIQGPSTEPSDAGVLSVDVTCTPCQHFTGRSLTDKFKTLWSSWAVEEVLPASAGTVSPLKLFFAGDTGYRSVMDNQKEEDVPVCPAFKQIGKVFNGFDVALIPIGAYLPRQFMSPIHCAPQDSVRIYKDIKAKKGLGMHWGTWVLTTEDVFEPPKKLAEEARKIGIPDNDFTVCDIGETHFFH
ncbi:N-acyl-phosphatidylethanolamine-hydrolyzing phospholipase D [Ephemerocybe angulata]|uniref:N-acyl-phosphatidylethanolamine-hydrolyzing phospholipase D n=1 Tax=Ephemerocybe angulata TaxID=980116 RepID=A0A8H6HTC3_9AGAR|nr:N-acyl-phosphatidylethanolamine-hydrolyzing phospholipase D [Tulosesus angulatus]